LLMEAAGELSLQDSHVWSSSLLDLHAAHGTSRTAMMKAAKTIQLREGSRKLFEACEQADVPTVILSAGIRDIIEQIIEAQNIHPTELLSIKLQFSEDGRVNGWDKSTLVLTHNKNETVRQHLKHIWGDRNFAVLVGDTVEDARMVEGTDNVLRIRVCDEVKDGQAQRYHDDEKFRQDSFAAGFDIVVDEDLSPIAGLVSMLQEN
jgi:HAD superfamily phosphoserine phosphatase-like hydrolase